MFGVDKPIAISKPEVQCAITTQPLTVMMKLHDALLCISHETGVK